MNTKIYIVVDTDNSNIEYRGAISRTISIIIGYFGSKNILPSTDNEPSIIISGIVTPEDIINIKNDVDNDSINYLIIENYDNSPARNGIFITLPKE